MRKTTIDQWPTAKVVIRLASRKNGATAAELAAALDVQPHTVRSLISRINASGRVGITLSTIGKRRAYRVARKESGR